GAITDATLVAEEPGSRAMAVDARLFLARLALARADSVEAIEAVRDVLLPVVGDPTVQALLEGSARIALLGGRARQGEPLAWFAAAEVARDALGAPTLATALFLRYADLDPVPAWRGKALLAALDVAPGEALRASIRGRAAALAGDPYVELALGGGASDAYEELER